MVNTDVPAGDLMDPFPNGTEHNYMTIFFPMNVKKIPDTPRK